jgi:hypothetical protein
MPLIETKGAASAQGFGEFTQTSEAVYIESCFSTYLYTGNGSTQTITNGIDLAGKGGLVWTKARSTTYGNVFTDTSRGTNQVIFSNSTDAQTTYGSTVTAFNSNGYSLGNSSQNNQNAATYASWTFRKQPKFFDVVTYTGDGSNRTISHNLDSVPGCIIVKRTDTTADWQVYHRSLANTEYMVLNDTAAKATGATRWNSTTPTSTVFSLGTDTTVNASGGTYVAYLFAHNAGGFGLSGTDNVISCGSYTGNGSTGQLINLGYEPQWVLVKKSASPDSPNSSWALIDNMRGWAQSDSATLEANTSNAENAGFSASGTTSLDPLGFRLWNANGALNRSGDTYIYIAIRRGPMKVPTSGTSVFAPVVATSGTATTNFPVDMQILSDKGYINANLNQQFVDRLRGASSTTTQQGVYLISSSTAAESSTYPYSSKQWSNTGFGIPQNYEGASSLYLSFRRAPGFFDVVCYTGTGSNTTQTHNLGVVPELIIVKRRDTTGAWDTYSAALSNTEYLVVNTTAAKATGATRWNSTTPTSTVFSLGTSTTTNASGGTYVAYLFATCAGVSKVGTYTGTGALQTINCGFTGGARFVLIKRTDSTGDWYVYDSARGISSGNDPYLLLNSTAAEVTGTNYVDTDSTGFKVTAAAPAGLNANGGSFVFLAIA